MKFNIRKNRTQITLFACLIIVLSFSLEETSGKINTEAGLSLFKTRNGTPDLKIHGVKIFVKDLGHASEFYSTFLGLSIEAKNDKSVKLNTGQYPLYLVESERYVPRNVLSESHYGISFLTQKLLPAIDMARKSGIQLYDTLLSRNGIGIHIPMSDPSGNLLHMMEVQVREMADFEGFRLYNSGTTTNNMASAEEFYTQQLGFEDWSRDYLPDALPLKHQDQTFAFMLHQNKSLVSSTYEYGTSPGVVLILETKDIKAITLYLDSNNISFSVQNDTVLITDNSNNVIEIIQKS